MNSSTIREKPGHACDSGNIWRGIPLVLLNLGLCLWIPQLLPHAGVSWWWILLWTLVLDALLLLRPDDGWGRWVLPALAVLLVAAQLLPAGWSVRSFGCLLGDLQDHWIAITGQVQVGYEASETGAWALLLTATLLQMLLTTALRHDLPVLTLAAFVPAGAALALGFPMGAGPACVLLAALLLMIGGERGGGQGSEGREHFSERNVRENPMLAGRERFAERNGRWDPLSGNRERSEDGGWMRRAGQLPARALLLGITGLIGLMVWLPLRHTDTTALWTRVSERIHQIRFDEDTNSMPEGDLQSVGRWKKSDTPALKITMEEPEKVYLRGHVYDHYTGTAWENAGPADRTVRETSDLFYWLHREGFYDPVQRSLAMIAAAGGESESAAEDAVRFYYMTVENLSACRSVSYLPYSYADGGRLDASAIENGSAGSGIDTFAMVNGGLADWYRTQKSLVEQQDGEECQEYLAAEEAYRSYIYEQDLQLTEEAAEVLERQLGPAGESMSMDQIQQQIYDYLSMMMVYEEDPDAMEESEDDFLTYVLEESGEGYSVHYATAAVLMLRYYGVPARYVEGYYMSREEAEEMAARAEANGAADPADAGESADGDADPADAQGAADDTAAMAILTENNAHAWAEYYLDGVGFVPFEVTPGYIDPGDLEEGIGADFSENQYRGNRTKTKDLEKPEVEPREEEPHTLPVGVWVLIACLVLCLLALAGWITRKRLRLRHLLETMEKGEPREAVTTSYAYAMLLRSLAHVEGRGDDDEARLLNEQAMFSPREMTGEQRAFMNRYRKGVLADCRRSWGFLRKLKLRWIRGIY